MSYPLCHLQMQEDELKDSIILVFANKQDLPNAMSASEITEKLGLTRISKNKPVRIVAECGRWCRYGGVGSSDGEGCWW